MKLQTKAFWIAAKLWLLVIICAVPRFGFASEQASNSPSLTGVSPAEVMSSRAGPVLKFKTYDAAIGQEGRMPTSGWVQAQPALKLFRLTAEDERRGTVTLWGKMRFEGKPFGTSPLAIYSVGNRDQFKVFVNGRELFRNYVHTSDHVQSWYRPFFIPIPPEVLKQGSNEIVYEVSGWRDLAVGWTFVGAQKVLKDRYEGQILARIYGPIVANAIMALLGLCAFMLWGVRRNEPELLLLGVSTVFWVIRNYHYYNLTAPFHPLAFAAVTHFSMYFAVATSASFCLAFLKTRFYKQTIQGLFAFGIVICGLHFFMPLSPFVIFLPAILIAIGTSIIGFATLRNAPSREHVMVSVVMCCFVVQALLDLLKHEDIWDGIGFYLQPYVGFAYSAVFLLTFGTRAQSAYLALNATNEILEKRVTQVRQELIESEISRADLKVNEAVATERVRLMQEIHDGIGSSLVTALAVAQRQSHPPHVIKTLGRVLSELKSTVDSLEPVDGDLVILIANLRHRMGNDLSDAGLTSSWEVTDCPPIAWLDPTSALHFTRIMQEAISNIIEHAQAQEIRIGCHTHMLDGRAGVLVFVADNGIGLSHCVQNTGKGIANMRSRARIIHAVFSFENGEKRGTILSLWMPFEFEKPIW